jgi:4'-phosphopantetheinyl transferase
MIYIYQADSKPFRENKAFNKLCSKLPVVLHERANRYKFEEDAYNFVLGRLLLKESLKVLGKEDQFEHIQYYESGKPFLDGISFNISHTENLVACAISLDGQIGVDIEKVKQVKLADFETWFTENEWTDIYNSPSQLQKFYWYWTRKESIIKALGVNLSYLHKIEIDASKDHFIENGQKWWLRDLNFGETYCGALCSETPITGLKQITITRANLSGT